MIKLKENYLCPHCNSHLRVWNNIIFTIMSNKNKKRGLLLLNPELGNYSYLSHASLKFEDGEIVEFFCPVCQTNLAAKEINENLIKIAMIDENGKEYEIFFSKIAGEHSTFKIEKDNILENFGDDVSSYYNYFSSVLKKRLKKKE